MVRALTTFLRPDLASRVLIVMLAPLVALSGATLWILDHHHEEMALSQTRRSVRLVESHIIRELNSGAPAHTILTPSSDASLEVFDANSPADLQRAPVSPEMIDRAILAWRRGEAHTDLVAHTELGPALRTIIPIERPATLSDRDNPLATIKDRAMLDRFAFLTTPLSPVASSWGDLRLQLALACVGAGFVVLFVGRTFAINAIVGPIQELRCRLGDALSPGRSLTTSLSIQSASELGQLSDDLETFRQTLMHDIHVVRDAIESFDPPDQSQGDSKAESSNSIDDASLQTEQLHHALSTMSATLTRLDDHTSSLQTQALRLEALATSLEQSSRDAGDASPSASSYAIEQTIERLASASSSLIELSSELNESTHTLSTQLPTSQRAIEIISSRLEHLRSIAQSERRVAVGASATLHDARRALDQYTTSDMDD
ncbi:MAG: hypothetical protein ACF8GE_01240 [Phycisphaerales bacterium JB043]